MRRSRQEATLRRWLEALPESRSAVGRCSATRTPGHRWSHRRRRGRRGSAPGRRAMAGPVDGSAADDRAPGRPGWSSWTRTSSAGCRRAIADLPSRTGPDPRRRRRRRWPTPGGRSSSSMRTTTSVAEQRAALLGTRVLGRAGTSMRPTGGTPTGWRAWSGPGTSPSRRRRHHPGGHPHRSRSAP